MLGRLIRASLMGAVAIPLALALYVGFIQAGLIRNPLAPVVKGDVEMARSDRPGLRVLFVGNSLTYYNDMPALLGSLARHDKLDWDIFAVSYTRAGFSLRQASRQQALERLLEEVRWDYVVLQEKSDLIALYGREASWPYAAILDSRIKRRGARTLLYMTAAGRDHFGEAQRWLKEGYVGLSDEISAPIVEVGAAWEEALRRRPIDLWAGDGRHPNLRGSYLAACVFYAYLTGHEPTGSSFTGGLPSPEARFLQRVGWDVGFPD